MNNLPALCVDANLVVRLVALPQDEAIVSLWKGWNDRRLIAPSLLLYEVVNALHQYWKAGYLGEEEVNLALKAAVALPIALIEDPYLHFDAQRLAMELNLPAAYDTHYLALAQRMGVELWTADRRLVAHAHNHGLTWVRAYP